MTTLALVLIAIPVLLFVYAYLGYPLFLVVLGERTRRAPTPTADPAEWPEITVAIPAYNAERSIARTLDALTAADYPAGRRHILVVSDGSTDRTDEIVRGYADRGVELLRQEPRGGKTAAENAAASRLRGSVVVNTDATIVVPPASLKHLVRPFQDPTIGVVSGRDVSVALNDSDVSRGEAGYSGYEMWVRSLESRSGLIAGATGSLYAARRELQRGDLPAELTRDFACTLDAYERGWRTVAVDDAICLVARAPSLRAELRRKARTMAHGVDTLWHYRRLMNPVRHGRFALMLLSHKLGRWLFFATLPLAIVGLAMASARSALASVALLAALLGVAAGTYALLAHEDRGLPAPLALCGYAMVAIVAALTAWTRFLRGDRVLVWEPTARSGE
ncbi:MAG: glycosyltransferase [Gemmatimonadaceae bacterium]|nr:glycosyltransferase [Gemmatimonadaceae bacterium]NUQ92166.1 glycosyltransferase [Gemmatimonadaceae bacterium]NUR20947.1 glycosyltransferase [Gemmatimonadaceae bacterium]NUS97086.1 glycosyltransferase [Gemmatimonadaceae bacterium]